MKRNIIFLFIFSLLISIGVFAQKSSKPDVPYLVVLSLDGFRWDYPSKTSTPNLDYIARQGVKAYSLRPSFPSVTFPNHYTMATGLYPDHHGIVNNGFFDPKTGKTYSMTDNSREDTYFYGGEPIWVTAEKQGIKTASYFWVGSEVAIENIRPYYWKRYEQDFPFRQRIDTVIAWLNLPEEKRPHLIMWYIHEPDKSGHYFGPDNRKTLSMVNQLDSLVGIFINQVKNLPIASKVNIIITSDHGMCPTSNDRVIVLSDFVNKDWFDHIQGYNPVLNLDVKDSLIDSAYNRIKKIPHLSVWKHGKLPKKLHYGSNQRTLDLIVLADSSWSVNWQNSKTYRGGTHGYDINNTDVHGIFYAMGPDFKQGFVQPTFDNVDLYSIFSRVLSVKPVKTDGSLKKVKGMFKEVKR
ncbi:MAG: ectonucleotide pyrophosphatase/phosphodiesterase [Lentimicrobiaceae bacterium]|nr:ectonucleotide pyrophosphatase/phosphodiesterase [Lentimicrobiaceae bacterium]